MDESEKVFSIFIVCSISLLGFLIWSLHDYNIKALYKCEECQNKEVRRQEKIEELRRRNI